jgi:hypothetical protein
LVLLSLDGRQQQAQREAAAIKELEQIVEELRLIEREAQNAKPGIMD